MLVFPKHRDALLTRSQLFKELKQYDKALEDANGLASSGELQTYVNDLNELKKKKVTKVLII